MSKQLLFLLALFFMLSACSQVPEYRRPELPVPTRWNDSQATAARPDLGTLLPEPRLQALIALALENNRDLRIATARVAEARALHGVQLADGLPNLDLSASRAASRTPQDLSLTGKAATAQRYDVGATLLSFELDFWGRVRSLNQAALASYLATEQAQRAFRLLLVADVVSAYFGLREAEERLVLTRATLENRQRSVELTGHRQGAGIASELDLLQARGAVEAVRAELANLERSRAASVNLLNQLVGVGVETVNLPPGRPLAEQGAILNLPVGLPAEVLLRRPDVLAAEQKLIAANANIGAARAAFFPRISLTGGIGTASRALSGLFDGGQGAWSFQPMLRLPLFDAGRSDANLDLAEARQHIAVAEYEKTVQQAFREVADLLAARQYLAEQLHVQERGEQLQAERLQLAEARHRAGVSNYLEVLDAQRDAYTAQQAVVQTRRILLSSVVQLFKALGGGSEPGIAGSILGLDRR